MRRTIFLVLLLMLPGCGWFRGKKADKATPTPTFRERVDTYAAEMQQRRDDAREGDEQPDDPRDLRLRSRSRDVLQDVRENPPRGPVILPADPSPVPPPTPLVEEVR